MRNSIRLIVVCDLIFVVLFALSGSANGAVSWVFYFAAFLVPAVFALFGQRDEGRELSLVCAEIKEVVSPAKRKLLLSLTLVFPAVFVVALASLGTSCLLESLGFSSPQVDDAPLALMLLEHALAPSVMEELLFRLVPLVLLRKISGKSCVFYSALLFSLIHCNLFQIPYAFIAGVVFMIIDLAFDSVVPSLVIHFTNNAISVISIKYFATDSGVLLCMAVLGALSALSVAVAFVFRRELKERLLSALTGRVDFACPSVLALVIPTLVVSVDNLF